MKSSKRIPLWLLIAITLLVFCWGMCWGRYQISIHDFISVLLSKVMSIPETWSQNTENAVWIIRFPRLCGAFLVGAALAMSGATYQGIFQNPLVSPDLLGVSAGACVGASIAILQGWGSAAIQILALIGGLSAVGITTLIPRFFRNQSNLMLVLAGMIVSGFFSSMQGLLKYIADPDTQLAQITFWTMGSLNKVGMNDILPVLMPMLLGMIVLVSIRWQLNLLSLGEHDAKTLGVNVAALRGVSILTATILTACSICLAGTVSWVGLVIPHLGRLLVGTNNKYLIPASIFLGAAFMIIIDNLARNLTGNDIPLSILTGFIGAPAYALMLLRQRSQV